MAGYKLPKVTQYVKNVGKSIAYASIDAVKANTRGVSDFIDVNNDVFKEVYASAKNIRTTIKNTEKQVRRSNLYKAIDIGVKNLIEDAKTGNFYRDRTEDYAESIIGLDDEFDMEFQSGSSEGASQKTLSDSINNAVGAAAISQNTAIAEGTGLIIKSNSANTKLMMASMEKISANFSAGMGAVYTGINATNQFLNGPMMAHLENSRRYYEETSKQLRDQSMMLKEMLEMQRNLYKKQSIDEKETRLAQSMTGTGGMNIRGYAKNVKSNIKDYMDSMGLSMFDMGGGGNPYLMFAASPFKLLLEPVAQRLMSPDFKKALRSFDKGINTFFSQLVAKLNNARDNSFGFGQIIGEIFGIKLDRKESINPGNYQKGVVPFDGVTRQAIIEVIPGYLSRIEAALTHSGERHYDHTSGTWKSAKRIQKNFEEEENRYITQANSGWLDALAPVIAGFERGNAKDKKKAKNLRNAASKMAKKIYQDGGDFDPNRGGSYYDISDRMLEIIVQNMSKSDMRNIAQDTMRAIQNRSSAMRAHEANGGPYRQLFNGAYDMEGKGNGSKNLPGDFKKNNLLTLATDSTGKNVFYYLREILGSISKRHGSQKGSMKGAVRVRSHSSQSSSTSGSSASSSSSTDDDSDPDPDDDAFWESYATEQRAKAEENAKQEKKAKMQDWIKTKMGNSPIGKVLGNMLGGAVNVLAKPMEYATKLLKKADEGMFQMMFGNKEYKLRNGEEATSVFQYIIDQVKGTFEELKDSIKKMFTNIYQKYLEPMLKPLWEKYGKPVADELKNMGKRAGARVRQAFNRFAEPVRNYAADRSRESSGLNDWYRAHGGEAAANYADQRNRENLANGGVVTASDIEGAQQSAFGRVVTKRGLTMISPGEIIIPASFDKREQNRMLALEKRDKKRILNAIQYNAKGTVDTEGMKDELRKIYNDNIGKAPKNIASGIVGAGAGLLTGINPLLGAAAGAGLSILSNSETLKSAIFGKEILEDGTREGGFVSNKIQKFFKKAMPDIGDFGIAGGLLGLLTPFGPLGGAVIGAGIGMLKNSEGFKKFIFGDAETGKDGLISKETYDKVVDKIKGSVPNIAVGAVGGALLGPFGILGNAVMGAGLGLLSSTDAFHKFIFGHAKGEKHEKGTPRKGLLGALERGIIDPAKEKIAELLDDFKKFAKKHVIEPLKRFWDPFQQMVKNLVSNVTNGIKDKLNDIFEKTIGIPISDFLQQKIFKPLTKTFFNILKAPYTLMKGAIAAPAHLLGFTGDNIRANQIRKGTAHNMTAEERLAWMQEHGVRNAMSKVKNARAAKKYGISFEERDRAIMGMSAEDQEKMMNMLRGNLDSMESLQRERGKARRMVGDEISTFFNTKDENGKLRYDKVGYGKVKRKLAQWAADGDFEKVEEWIKNANLSDQEKKDLMKSIKPYMQNAKQANDAMSSAREGGAGLDEQLEKLFGRKMNRRGKRNVMEALKAEINARKQNSEDEMASEEKENTDATNDLNQTINDRAKEFNDRTKDILEALKDLNSNLVKMLERQKNSNTRTKRRKKGKGIAEVATEAAEGIAGLIPINADDVENATTSAKGGFFKKKGLSMVSKGETVLPSFMSKFFKKFDKDSKEAVEERQAEEKARKAEEEETIETKKTNSILMKLHDKFFGNKEEKEKDGLGILSKLGSGFSKFSKFLGVGGKVALGIGGISLFGHATEWFKTKIWPVMKTGLFGEDGHSGLLGGVITKVKTWFETGGFHKLFSEKIIPNFVTGLSYTMENVVGPGIALLIKHLPSILWGLAKGLFKGLKSLVFKDKMDGQEEKQMLAASGLSNSSAFLSDFQKMNGQKSKALENHMDPAMKEQLSAVTSGNNIAYGSSSLLSSGLGSGESKAIVDYTTNTSSSVTNNYITQNADKFGDGELENPNETLTVRANGPMGLLGRRKNTNIVRYDENGNVLTMYDTRNTQESALSATAKAAGLSFRKGLFTGKGSSKLLNKLGSMKWAKPKAGIVGNIVGGTKNTIKTGAKGINFFGKLGDKMHGKLYGSIIDDSRMASGLDDWFKTRGGEAAANFAEARNQAYAKQAAKEAAENVAEGAAKTGAKKGIIGNLKNAWNKTIGGKMANSSSKVLKGAAENVAEKGVVKGLASAASSKVKTGVKSVTKMAGDAISSSSIVKGLKEVFEKIAGSAVVEKICGFAKKVLKKAVDPSVVQDAIRVIGTQIAEKCAKGTAKTAIKEATEQIANACTLGLGTIAFFVADFIYGYNNAYTMLGVAKGSEFKVNIGHKCACGLLHAVINLIPFVGGFIPTNVLMQLIMEKILPIFGYDPSSLQAAQEESSKILDEWNKAHPDEQYDNLEDFNNKDKWTTKAGKWIKEKTSAAGGWIKDKAGKAGSWIKDKASAAGSWIKDKATKAGTAIKEGAKKAGHALTGNVFNDDEIREQLGLDPDVKITFQDRIAMGGASLIEKLTFGTVDTEKTIKKINGAMEIVKNKASETWDNIKKTTSEKWDSFKTGAKKAMDTANDKLGSLLGMKDENGKQLSLTEGVKHNWQTWKTKAAEGWDNIKNKASETWKNIKEGTTQKWEDLKTGVSEGLKKSNEKLGSLLGMVDDEGNQLSLTEGVSYKWDKWKTKAAEGWSNVKNMVSDTWSNIKEGTQEKWKQLKENISGGLTRLDEKLGSLFGMEDENGKPQSLSTALKTKFNATTTKLKDGWKSVKEKAAGFWDGVKNWFGNIGSALESSSDAAVAARNEGGSGKGGYGRKRYGFSRYSQLDPSIAGMQYNGHTIGQAGCGPVAAANLINNIKGGNVSVQDTAKYATAMGYKPRNDGTNPKYMNSILSASGIPNETIGRSGIDRSLKQGNPVVIMGRGNSPRSPYGNQNPHYITAMGYDRNGNVIVDDPYENGYKTYKKSDVVNGAMRSVSAKRSNFGRGLTRKLRGFKYGMARSATNPADIIHQNLGSWSPMTEEEMNAWINANCSGKNSTFIGNGKVFIDAANKTGLDPRYILAHAALESGWGTSKISRDKNNYFGIGAFDASPYKSAYSFGSGIAAGIIGGAEWIRKNYYDSNYKQTTLYKMRFNNNVHQYATDPEWANKIATIMAKCPVPNTNITYDESQVSWNGSDVSRGSSTLLSQFSNLGTSMVKAMFGDNAYDALYGQNNNNIDDTSGITQTATGDSTATGNIGAYLNTVGGSSAKEYGPGSGTQCVELPNHYATTVLGANQKGGNGNGNTYAKNISNRFPDIFTYYDPSNNMPKAGDIISLVGNQTQYGHAALVKSTSGNTINILEQWKGSGTVRDSSFEYPGTGNRKLLGIARPKNGMGKGEFENAGVATNALMANSAYRSETIPIPNRTSAPVSAGVGVVDYATFLQTIVTILMNIADNTALLGKVLEILSNNFGIDIDKTDIDKAKSKTKAQTEKALTDLVNKTNGNTVGVSKLLNNKDTEYIVAAMRAIATE